MSDHMPAAPKTEAAGFFKALFDFSFTHFITPKIVKVVYVLATIGIVIGWIAISISVLNRNAGAGVAVLTFGTFPAVLYLAFFRMMLEFNLSVVRMSEDIHKRLPAAESSQSRGAPSPTEAALRRSSACAATMRRRRPVRPTPGR